MGHVLLTRPSPAHPFSATQEASETWFRLVLAYLVVDIAKPQALIAPLAALRPGLVLTLLLGCYVAFNLSMLRRTWNKQCKYICAIVLLLVGLVPFAHNNFRAFEVAVTMVQNLPFFLSIVMVVTSRRRLLLFFQTLMLILLYTSLYSLTHGGHGPGGIMADENDFSLFVVLALPYLYVLYTNASTRLVRLMLLSVTLLAVLAMVLAISRGGFVGFVLMIGTFWLFSKRKLRVLGLVAAVAVVMIMFGGSQYTAEMQTITDTKENTANERLLSWLAGIRMFVDHPLGIGGNNFPVLFYEYQPEGMRRNMWGRAAHSFWFTAIPETGVIGITLLFFLIRQNFRNIFSLIRHYEPLDKDEFYPELGRSFLASFMGFFGAATFISVLYYSHFWYMSCLLAAAVRLFNSEDKALGLVAVQADPQGKKYLSSSNRSMKPV
jgi:O-antigen ligase